jgi:DNA-binding SARP family transcriptional activator/tetratricopeptide (TPR) repeat protein
VGPADRLSFYVCGGLSARCGDEDLALTSVARQGRLVLAYLVLNHDRAITRGELMERVFTHPDPERVGASLSQTLSRLRAVFGRERIEPLPGGAVRLRGPVTVDIEDAEEALKEGHAALRRGEWAAAAASAERVTEELAGEVLAGDEVEWLEEVRRSAADMRVDALELRASAALRMGEWGDALAAARAASAISPTREAPCALLMKAQAGQGDIALATQTFHEFRGRLAEELGLPPSADLIELHQQLVAGASAGDQTGGGITFPPALRLESGDEAFVGRAGCLDRLRERYARARAGRRQFVVVCGEPGIGKTRVAAEFAREAHDAGAIVLYGRSDPETLVPYQPFVTAIGAYVTECGDAALARERGPDLSELSRLIPSLARRLPELREPLAVEPEMRHYRLFNAVVNVLAFVAHERPVVLVLDDLHWGDRSTALLLHHAIHEIHEAKLLILGTVRDVEGYSSDLLADLLAQPRREFLRITLGGLDAAEIGELIAARQGRDAGDGAVGALQRATSGNPLLLEETLKVLAGSELSERAVQSVGVPEGVKHMLGRRLARLSDTAQRVLADASVVGAEFGVPVVEAVTDVPAELVIPALEDAEAAGLVRDAGDRFTFSHALVRETLLEAQSTPRRRRLHQKIGEALEDSPAVHPATLAHHFIESGEPGRALPYTLAAGRRAQEALAHEDAAGHFERALQLLGPADERRCAVLLELGRVQLRQGTPAARATFRRAFELAGGAPEPMALAALGLASRYTEVGVVDTEGISMLDAARVAVGPGTLHVELTARLADSLHFAGDPGESERLSRQALEMARTIGDPHALAAALESRHAALLSIEHLDERLRLSSDLVELAEREGERELMALGRHWRIYDLLEAERMADAQRQREALNALADELRQPLYQHFAAGWDVVWAHMDGHVDEIEALAQRFYDLGVKGQARDTETIYRAQIIALRRRQERLPDFVTTVLAAVEAHPNLHAWRAVLPLTHLAAGDPAAAVAEFEWLAHDAFSRVRRDMFWLTTTCVLAETCALLRDSDRAAVLYEQLEPFCNRSVQVTQAANWGSVERFLGLLAATLGRWEAADAHLESAIAKNAACGNVAAASLVRRDLAKVLLARRGPRDLDRAAALLREPLRAAEATRSESLIACVRAEVEAVERERGQPAHA